MFNCPEFLLKSYYSTLKSNYQFYHNLCCPYNKYNEVSFLSVVDVSGEGAVDELADGRGGRPVAEVAARGVGPAQRVPVLALVQARAAVVRARHLRTKRK